MGMAVPADDLPSFDLKSALAATDKELKLPAGLSAAQIQIESGGNTRALSKAGAMGLAQVMPQTLAAISKRLGRELDPYNEQDAVEIHREVMRENLAKFKDPSKALMAYNGGWDESKWGNKETAAYVGKINAQRNKQPPMIAAADKVLTAISGTANASSKLVPADDLPDTPNPKREQDAPKPKAESSLLSGIGQGIGNLAAGAVRGAGSIGATILAPYDMAKDAMAGKGLSLESNRQRRKDMDDGLQAMGAQPDSMLYQGGKLAGEIAGTAGAGSVLGNGVRAISQAPRAAAFANALTTSGFKAGATPGAANMLTRVAGGAITGGTAAGLVNPSDAGVGAVIGGVLPGAATAAGKAGGLIRKGLTGGGASDEVAALAARAKELGITIPADRVVNSKPLNALAATLNYVPFSGRAATEANMGSQLNRALSRTFGQDSDNVTGALRKANEVLGAKFDDVLKNNTVQVDDALMTRLGDIESTAGRELGSDGMAAIKGQISELMDKGATGQIDGQAAYNIKRTLDRIGKRSTPEAFHAREMKGALMEALDRSIGPEKAAAFATTRKQYGNMLSLEKIAQNGAEGDISVARMANMKNINNAELQELADIAAQFVKTREGQHGAMQRAIVGGAGFVSGGIPGLAAGATVGRATNMLLNSNVARNAVMRAPTPASAGTNRLIQGAYRAAPVLPSR